MASVERLRESSQSPSSSSTRQPKYDVFLSFRGEDTRINFTDHLYEALKQKGIITFRDEEELKKGEPISELFKAIEESQFAIIIFSKKYASSTWCLDELVKIIKCEDETGLKVLPVFYNVSPSIVRKQTGTFKKAFTNHQKRFEDNIEKVETWRDTLKKVADIKGWDLHLQNRHESEIIQDIVKVIMAKLSSKSSKIDKNLIGVKSMVAKLIPSYLGFGNKIYMMGICGMGGLGKTTLASAIYCEYSDHFEGSSFIANVREISENGKLHELQQQLLDEILGGSNTKIYNVLTGVDTIKRSGLRNKKVLLVLDDVNHKAQLEKLAGAHDWFGLGSWIIITTRDEHVLVDHGVFEIYKPNGLVDDDASKLFCLKAFKNVQPKEGYMQLSKEVVGYASGLPLALVTLGSFLAERNIDLWKSALEALKKNLNGEIFNILKISYDGLEEMWKETFLDIACFFRGMKKDEVIEILEKCGLNARIGISVLMEKSLLTIEDSDFLDRRKWLTMHDLLREMGKKIVCQESGGNLGKQSRLWLKEDLLDVLENKKATEAIQAIVVSRWEKDFKFQELSLEGFSKMSNLRLLVIAGVNSPNDQRHLALPNNLRYLHWESCPLKCLAFSHKQKMALVHLELRNSKLEYLWEGKMGLLFHKAVLGGYIIRSWSAVKEGFSIDIKLPSNWCNSKWIGFALWVSVPQLPCVVEVKDGIRAHVKAPGGMPRNHGACEHSTTYRDGICLLYLSREVWFDTVGNDECNQVTVEFKNNNSSCSTVHIWGECGVSFIYKQGVVRVGELNETNAPCFIESFGEGSIYKLTGGDDDVHIVDDDGVHIVDDDGVHKFRDDVHKFGDDDFDVDDI